MQEEIAYIALEQLQKNTSIQGIWKNDGVRANEREPYDGILELTIDGQKIDLCAEIKKEVRGHQLMQLFQQAEHLNKNQKKTFMVIAERIFPKIKEELRNHHIAYLEANGNLYLRHKGIYLWIEGNKPYQSQDEGTNRAYPRRAFTKTGLKVVFHLLMHEDWVNKPYRELAELTDVGLGNINYIYNGLKELGFLMKKNKDTYLLTRKKELLEKWMVAYEEKLKPALKIGNFRFAKPEAFAQWKTLNIRQEKTCWGGEAAADLLTGHLRPDALLMYTSESRSELMKNYRLIPNQAGPVTIYQKFWYNEEALTAPPLLVYTDLMNNPDKRNLETAKKTYDKFLREHL